MGQGEEGTHKNISHYEKKNKQEKYIIPQEIK